MGPLIRREQAIVVGLLDALGSSYDKSEDGIAYARAVAVGRAIAALWSTNARMRNQFDPRTATDYLERWERILALYPRPSDTLQVRRSRCAAKLAGLQGNTREAIDTACRALIGEDYIGVETVSLSSAVANWPGNGHATSWDSALASIVVRIRRPQALSSAAFDTTLSGITSMLDAMMPATCTFTIALLSESGTSSFILDEQNLDLLTFG